jgi:hypothetical protein
MFDPGGIVLVARVPPDRDLHFVTIPRPSFHTRVL